MTQKNAAEALAAYDALYKNPRTGEHIIDGDEAQVAADLAAAVRNLARFEPSRTPPADLAEAADAPVLPEMERGEVRALPTPSAAVVDAAALGADLPGVSVAPLPAAPLPSRVEIPRDGFEPEHVAPRPSGSGSAARTTERGVVTCI